MALTNYMMQVVLLDVLFTPHGFGMKIPALLVIPAAIALFVAQVYMSRWWLSSIPFRAARVDLAFSHVLEGATAAHRRRAQPAVATASSSARRTDDDSAGRRALPVPLVLHVPRGLARHVGA